MSEFARFEHWSPASIEEALEAGDVADLRVIPIVVTLQGSPDPEWSERICFRLSSHADSYVRGNAMLGLGHLARVHGIADPPKARSVLAGGARDPDAFVRSQASNAADDLDHFLP